MTENGTFSRLVAEMTLEERNNLLERLTVQSNISTDPLYEETEEHKASPPDMSVEDQFARLPWYYRLWFSIMSLFRTIPPLQLFEDRQIAKCAREVEAHAPGIYDYKRNIFLPLFEQILMDLKEGARFFYAALDGSVNRDKGAFYAFLGSLEMGDIHSRLEGVTNIKKIVEKFPRAREAELRQVAVQEMEKVFAEITEEQRSAMYGHARSLVCLKELAAILYDRILLTFEFDNEVKGKVSSANVIKDQLKMLNNTLHSFKEPPSIALIESLFVFMLQSQFEKEDADADIDAEMRTLMSKAEDALVTIRTFNREIPLNLILCCVERNVLLEPDVIPGGEDWFIVYQDYWKGYIEEHMAEHIRHRRQQELLESFRSFLKGKSLGVIEHAESESNPNGLAVRGVFSLSFLLTFYSVIFINDINNVLRVIIIDGKFSKREDRTAFTENYNNLIKLEEDIKKFDNQLSPSGDYGKRYNLASTETSISTRRRKIQIVLDDASGAVTEMVERTKTAIKGLIVVLELILRPDKEGNYNTLINMGHFLGKDDVSAGGVQTAKGLTFINNMNDVIQKLQKTLQILDDIDATEFNK